MQSMFKMGFDREVFSQRHPEMGISISDLESFWKTYYPTAKADIKPLLTSTPTAPAGAQPIPASTPLAPTYPPGTPVSSPTNLTYSPPSSSSSGMGSGVPLLLVGALGLAGVGVYMFTSKKPFGIKRNPVTGFFKSKK